GSEDADVSEAFLIRRDEAASSVRMRFWCPRRLDAPAAPPMFRRYDAGHTGCRAARINETGLKARSAGRASRVHAIRPSRASVAALDDAAGAEVGSGAAGIRSVPRTGTRPIGAPPAACRTHDPSFFVRALRAAARAPVKLLVGRLRDLDQPLAV